MLLFYLAILVCGVVTAYLATDNTALSAHPNCGTYYPNAINYDELLFITNPYESAIQDDSANWARTCYGAEPGADGCNDFVNQEIPFTVQNSSCPFPDASMCYENGTSSVQFTTGAVSGSIIGVNAPQVFEFNRTSTCSPLNMNRTFIKLFDKTGSKSTFRYYYGNSGTWEDASWESVRHGDIGEAPTYLINTLTWSSSSTSPEWVPIPGIQPIDPVASSITIIFIVSQKIFYPQPSYDPIFPALDFINKTEPGYWMNIAGPGTVLACVDTTVWRTPSANDDEPWGPLSRLPGPEPTDPHTRGAMYFLNSALYPSNTYSSLSLRGSSALAAQSKINGFLSAPLAPEQWKVEAESLFKTSLTHIQFNARNIARGVPSGFSGYLRQNRTPEFCRDVFALQATGWQNVDYAASWWIIGICAGLVVAAVPTDEDALLIESFCSWLHWHRITRAVAREARVLRTAIIVTGSSIYHWGGWQTILDFAKTCLVVLQDGTQIIGDLYRNMISWFR